MDKSHKTYDPKYPTNFNCLHIVWFHYLELQTICCPNQQPNKPHALWNYKWQKFKQRLAELQIYCDIIFMSNYRPTFPALSDNLHNPKSFRSAQEQNHSRCQHKNWTQFRNLIYGFSNPFRNSPRLTWEGKWRCDNSQETLLCTLQRYKEAVACSSVSGGYTYSLKTSHE